MWAQEELRPVVTWLAFYFFYLHLSCRKRSACLGGLARYRWVTVDVVHQPIVEPGLHLLARFKRADLVPYDALEVMRETAGCEHVGKTGRQLGIGGSVRVVVRNRLVHCACADECGEVGVLAVDKRHESGIGQLVFASVGDGR